LRGDFKKKNRRPVLKKTHPAGAKQAKKQHVSHTHLALGVLMPEVGDDAETTS
jgi:hypothetical protein